MDAFSISGWVIGLIGLGCSLYYGNKAEVLKKDIRTFSWAEIIAGTHHLAGQIKRDGVPMAFFSTDARGGLIAKLIADKLGAQVPVYVGICFDATSNHPTIIDGFFNVSTDRWSYFLPNAIASAKQGKLVLVDDVAFSGETLAHICRKLREDGFSDVAAATLLTSEIASRQQIGPRWYWRKTPFSEIIFPWGRMM